MIKKYFNENDLRVLIKIRGYCVETLENKDYVGISGIIDKMGKYLDENKECTCTPHKICYNKESNDDDYIVPAS